MTTAYAPTHPHGVPDTEIFGVMAEFESAQQLVDAATAAHNAGYIDMDAYSPFPIPEIDHAIGIKRTILPWVILTMGIIGGSAGFFMQWYSSTIHYPLNIGGRPTNSWPMFIPITFEMTILFSAFTAGLGMLIMNGFPKHYHPVFNVPAFERASSESFFLCIEHTDAQFDRNKTTEFLKSLNPLEVSEVAP